MFFFLTYFTLTSLFMLYFTLTFSLTSLLHSYFTLYTSPLLHSSFTHLIRTDKYILFNSCVVFHCAYVPQLSYPFIPQWTSRLLPSPSYCKQCCNEHWGTHVSFNYGFLSVYAQQWDCWIIWKFYFQFFTESPHCSLWWMY